VAAGGTNAQLRLRYEGLRRCTRRYGSQREPFYHLTVIGSGHKVAT